MTKQAMLDNIINNAVSRSSSTNSHRVYADAKNELEYYKITLQPREYSNFIHRLTEALKI